MKERTKNKCLINLILPSKDIFRLRARWTTPKSRQIPRNLQKELSTQDSFIEPCKPIPVIFNQLSFKVHKRKNISCCSFSVDNSAMALYSFSILFCKITCLKHFQAIWVIQKNTPFLIHFAVWYYSKIFFKVSQEKNEKNRK